MIIHIYIRYISTPNLVTHKFGFDVFWRDLKAKSAGIGSCGRRLVLSGNGSLGRGRTIYIYIYNYKLSGLFRARDCYVYIYICTPKKWRTNGTTWDHNRLKVALFFCKARNLHFSGGNLPGQVWSPQACCGLILHEKFRHGGVIFPLPGRKG